MNAHRCLRLCAILLGFAMPTVANTQSDSLYTNARIYQATCKVERVAGALHPIERCTGHTYVEAMMVKGGKIAAVGSTQDLLKSKNGRTQVIDLHGQFVMPGFNDAHIHLAEGGIEKLNVELVGTKSLEEMQRRIAERVKTASAGEWIQGRGWDHTKWTVQKLPTRQDLDGVTAGHPAIFIRVDGHIAVANSAALKAAGISKGTPDPPGGKIDRDASGEATGILREGAQDLVFARIPKPTPAQRRRAIELALAEASQWGLTSLQDNSPWADFLVYEELEREGKLHARISEWLAFLDPLDVLIAHRAHHDARDPMLHTSMLKGFMDGSLGSRTAVLLKPYADDPQNTGLPQYEQGKLNQMADERLAAGFQMGFHAIGDGGVKMALDAFADAMRYVHEKKPGAKLDDLRLRVEHAQVTTPEQITRFGRMGVIASMQPNHLLTDMNWAMDRLGPERAKSSYAWKSFLDAGARLAFGTDYPVEPLTPFRGLYAAVTRKNEAGTKEYFPEEKITIDEAIAAYTKDAAYAEFAEHSKGELKPGQWADFVILDRDITSIPPEQILQTKVLRTVVGGRTVYESGSSN